MKTEMTAAFLPGNSTVEMRTVPIPVPGHGEALLRVKVARGVPVETELVAVRKRTP